jgi:archaemetzincin
MSERVGVYSLIRYTRNQDGESTLLRRALKVLNHEIGHILGLAHCIFYQCTMNGSNSLWESDRRPIHLCPVCREKLEWNLGCDRLTRYRGLRDFYRKVGFERDAAFLAEKVAALERQGDG